MSKEIIHVKLGLKPFSANKMHYRSGKKDTREYREFKGDINEFLAGDYGVDKKAMIKFTLVSGFSNKQSDLDNAFKPLLDAMQLAMGFNDNQIYDIIALKDVVPKGEEYILIKLEQVSPSYVKRKIAALLRNIKGDK